MLSLIQEHTRLIYHLDDKNFNIRTIKARELLIGERFDIFAKLFYIRYKETNKAKALEVYTKHIKAFNPDGKEPGREDKLSIADFTTVFDDLISYFKDNEFDASISVIPVDSDGVILDGAHRLAALAYYDKDVTIAQFSDVKSKCKFDYNYFMNRGLRWEICNLIALEMVRWLPNVYCVCLWPKLSIKDKEVIFGDLSAKHNIIYKRAIHINLSALTKFVQEIYKEQDWTKSFTSVQNKALRCYGNSGVLKVVFIESKLSLNEMIEEKEELRKHFNYGKDSLHITDNSKETYDIANLVLDCDKLISWNPNQASKLNRIKEKISERILYFKKVQWINFKVLVARTIRTISK